MGSIKKCVTALQEDIKTYKMKKAATHVKGTAALKADAVKARMEAKHGEVRTLLSQVKGNLALIGDHLKMEKGMLTSDIRRHKERLADVLGYGDEVRGFDQAVADENLDQLEIYREFLGEKEYAQVQLNYQRALQTMEMLYKTEIQRLSLQQQPGATGEVPSQEHIQMVFTPDQIKRFAAVFDSYQKQGNASRHSYMGRAELEFRMDSGITRGDLDALDAYFQHKRWLKQKEKALVRDWQREKAELKEKTVALIEAQVEETSQRLKQEFEQMKMQRVKAEKHANLEELKKEYNYKMDVINEIREEQKLREQHERLLQDRKKQKRAEEVKGQASEFKHQREAERKRQKEELIRVQEENLRA